MKTKIYIMNPKLLVPFTMFVVLFSFLNIANAQIPPNAYTFESLRDGIPVTHLFLMDKDYLVHTIYSKSPPSFIKTVGGFYELKPDRIILNLEFNSEFKKDSLTRITIPYTFTNNELSLGLEGGSSKLNTAPRVLQDLDGKWLMAGRVSEEGENRRDTTRPRKTMKFLLNGYFQWIAFNTETMDFFGTGGGVYTSEEGTYKEHIQFFSRDSARAGTTLKFTYDKKDGDWHHMGKSSKGDPLHEIWSPRN